MKSSIALLMVLAVALTLTSCSKSDNAVTTAPPAVVVPVLTTSAASNITQTTSTSGGNISSDGGASVTARGVCWGTGATPTVADFKTSDGTGTGSFASAIIGLTASTSYSVRAYATNSAGTGYGNTITFAAQALPVILNNGTTVTWISTMLTIGNPGYSPLDVLIVQNGGTLSGTNRDNNQQVDVITTGTINGAGNVSLTAILTNGGSPRQTLVFTGTVSGSGSSQTISGTYTGTPSESGTFTMRHN